MRKLLVFVVILLVLVGLFGFALMNLNALVERNKGYLIAQTEQALGRKVSVQAIGVSVWGGIGIRLKDFGIADDPAFASGDFIRATDLQIHVAFLPLLSKELQITRLTLYEPKITIMRNTDGQFNFASLTPLGKSAAPGDGADGAAKPPASSSTASSAAFALLVSLVNIEDGEIRYVDQRDNIDTRFSQLDLDVEDFNFEQPVALTLAVAVLAAQQNLFAEVEVGPIGPALDALDTLPLAGKVTLEALSVKALQKALPQIAARVPSSLGLSGPLYAKTDISGRLGALTFTNLSFAAAVFDARKPNFQLTGQVGPVAQDVQTLPLSADIELSPVSSARLRNFAPLAASLPVDLNVEGPLSLTAHVEGSPDNLAVTSTLTATESRFTLGDRFHKAAGIPCVLAANARVTPAQLTLQQAQFTLHTLVLNSTGKVGLGNVPVLDLTVGSAPVELAGWRDLLPLLHAYDLFGSLEVDAKIRGPLSKDKLPNANGKLMLNDVRVTAPPLPSPVTDLNALVTFTGQSAIVKNATLRLGDSQLQLDAQVQKFTPLTLTYQLSSPELRLADIQPRKTTNNNDAALKSVTNTGRAWMEDGVLLYRGDLASPQGTLAGVAYQDLKTEASLTGQAAILERLQFRAFKGSIQSSGRYTFSASPPRLSVTSRVQDLNVTNLFRSVLPTVAQNIQGQANLELSVAGTGKTWEELKPTLTGQGQGEVVQGALLDINIAEDVLSGITGLPGLSHLISPRVRKKYPTIFDTQNTDFEELRTTFTLGDGKVNIEKLRIAAADYAMNGTGWLTLDQELDLHARLVLSQALSKDLIKDVKEAKYIANDEGRMEVPFALAGTLPGAKPKPDVAALSRLLQSAIVRKGAEELQEKILKKFLPGATDSSAGTASQSTDLSTSDRRQEPGPQKDSAPSPPAEQPPKSLEEDLIHKGLESLFGR